MSSTQSLMRRVPQLHRAGGGRPVVRRRALSLYLRVVSVNAAVLLVAVLVLVLTPAGVSSETSAAEGVILALVLVLMVVGNALLLRVTFSGLTTLARRMETLDVLQPRERLRQMGGEETRALITGFNTMLDRLEEERLASTRRMVTTLEGERQRIGQELHDEIGQRLTGILLQLARIMAEAPDTLQPRIMVVQNEARATLDEVGALAWQVRPGVLDDLGLLSALDALVDSLGANASARVDTALPDRLERMASEVELAVYRVAQEALTNAIRHSGATAIRLELRRTGQDLVLQVTDNGRGLSGREHEGPGLRGMRERALLVGGRLRVHAQAPGLRIRLAIPARLRG
jgi:two-component system sensor histidine kinase UhpB